MSQANFLVSLKSTIDKLANTLATTLGVQYVDLDDVTTTAALFRGEATAIVMEFGTLEADPSDPIYAGSFNIGARTVQDPGNYDILKLVGEVEQLFPRGQRILVYDSFEELETGLQGILVPGDITVIPQQYDMSSGFRLMTVTFKAQRLL